MKKIILMSLFTLFVHSAKAVEVVTSSFGTVNVIVSSTEPNIIHVKNDSIIGLTAKYSAVTQQENTENGSVIFSTEETKPFSILIETEKGFTFNVNATPSSKAKSNPIIISNLSDKGSRENENEIESFASYSSYSGLISHILTEIINDKIPTGFVETSKTKFEISKEAKTFFKVKNSQAWVGRGMRIVKLDITNISTSRIELNERYIWNNNVMAISYYPSVSELPPNTRVYAYVVLKEVE